MRNVLLVLALLTAFDICAAPPSESQRRLEKERKALFQKKAAQAQEKQKQEDAEKARQELTRLYNEEPESFFGKYLNGHLAIDESGKVCLPSSVSGRVVQIISDKALLLDQGYAEPVAVVGFDTSKLVDGSTQAFAVKEAGRYQYITVLGATKTVKKYEPAQRLTLEAFNAMRTNGVDFLSMVTKDLVR